MKEIGSEFWDIPLTQNKERKLFPDTALYYLSGRSALNAILDDICRNNAVKTAALPSWCCDSMIKPFLSHGLEVHFYPIYLDESQRLVQEIESVKSDVLLVMDYFGFLNCPDYKKNTVVIRDITHSVFSGINNDADYVFGSLRKWTGLYTGGFAWSNISELAEVSENAHLLEYYLLRQRAMKQKKDYINSGTGDKSFLALFSEAEEWLDNNAIIYGSSERDRLAINMIDAYYIRERRVNNAKYLLQRLGDLSFVKHVEEDECPLFVPIFLDNPKRNCLRKYLIENSIYCPIHWGISDYHQLTVKMREIYDTELSLVCDQRYDLSDMKRIADTVELFMKG